jgi:hypothetical protein
VGKTRGTRETERSLLEQRLSRARFLRLAGTGAGLSLFPASLSVLGETGSAQTAGTPAILSPSGEFPIGVWWPPPPKKTTPERYEQIKNAGFNFVIGGNGVTSGPTKDDPENDLHKRALYAAEANGLRFVLTDNILQNITSGNIADPDDPKEAVTTRIERLLERYATSPALAGMNLYDEPPRRRFGILGFAKGELQRLAPEQLPYVNVWPSYASPSALGTRTYERYLELYRSEVDPPLLSFDHYPLLSKNKITGSYFSNWAVIRRFSMQVPEIPSWGFIQSVGFDGGNNSLAKRRTPDKNEIFWQINVSLAYGAKGIQYFTYWTPKSDRQTQFGDALVARDGTPTPRYEYAREANEYFRVIGKALLPLTSESVVQVTERSFKPDTYLRSVNGNQVILGRFLDKSAGTTDRYLFVANRSFLKAAQTKLALSDLVSGVSEVDSVTGDPVPVTLTGTPPRNLLVNLAPGRARLYLLQTN